MKHVVSLSELEKIPFVDVQNVNGRVLSNTVFHDGKWRMWFAAGEPPSIREMQIHRMGEGYYFALQPASATDLKIKFLDFVAQHASFNEVIPVISGIQDDVLNLAASVAKFPLLHRSGIASSRMIATEIEYLVTLCRSIFDLLQEALAALWANVTLTDPAIKKKKLPKSFADIVMFKGSISDSRTIAERFVIPLEIAQCYERGAEFFIALRTLRDRVVHGGTSLPSIYSLDDGLYIQQQLIKLPNVAIWRESERRQNGLAPLMPAIGAIVSGTLKCCDDFSSVFSQTIGLLPKLVPDMDYFVTSAQCADLHSLLQDAESRSQEGLY